eukprot:SAG22_NODE_4_length_44774_cov_362.122149_14_plen_137_part_00
MSEEPRADPTAPPYYLVYACIAFPAAAVEVLSTAAARQQFLRAATSATVAADLLRVLLFVAGWSGVVCVCRYLPDRMLPAWYAAKRKGPEALKLYGDAMKPATMTVSWMHAIVAVVGGLYLLLPDMLGAGGRSWKW